METPNPFDLSESIRNWRSTLEQSSTFRCEDLAELEAHLRDSIERLTAKDLSHEEAFLIATKRLGTVQRLNQEFAKVNRSHVWQERLLWMLLGVLLVQVTQELSSVFTIVVSFSTLPMNRHLLGALLLMIRWAVVVSPFLLILWLAYARPERCRRLSARALNRPVVSSICLVVIPAIPLLLLLLIRPFGELSSPNAEGMARFQTVSKWSAYGFIYGQQLLIPIALVYLARRRFATAERT
jgi:hypothetical protein